MKIYRSSIRDNHDEHMGYDFHLSKREAKKAHEDERSEVEEIEIPVTSRGVLYALKQWASHPNNG